MRIKQIQKFKAIKKDGVIDVRKVYKRKHNLNSEYYLTPDEIKKVITSAPTFRDRILLKLLAYTGMRRDELRNLKVEDVDFEKETIHIRVAKFGKPRTVMLDPGVLQELRFYLGERKSGYIFPSRENPKKPLTNRQINNIVAKAGERANITNPCPDLKHLNPHIFRHSFARNFLKQGGRMEVLQKMLGHASIKTTIDIYGEVSLDDVKEEYSKRMEGIYG